MCVGCHFCKLWNSGPGHTLPSAQRRQSFSQEARRIQTLLVFCTLGGGTSAFVSPLCVFTQEAWRNTVLFGSRKGCFSHVHSPVWTIRVQSKAVCSSSGGRQWIWRLQMQILTHQPTALGSHSQAAVCSLLKRRHHHHGVPLNLKSAG